MNWEWAVRRARQLSVIFNCRYTVYGTKHDMGNGIQVWMYLFRRTT